MFALAKLRRSVRALARQVARRPPARRAAPRRCEPVDEAFLRSPAYAAEMNRHLPAPGAYDRHEAQHRTPSFVYRHHEANHRLGPFRWRGIQEHLELLLDATRGRRVVDFGGGACPLGLGSVVVDSLDVDALGRPVRYPRIEEVDFAPDVVFTSHTLEHVEPLDRVLRALRDATAPGGALIAHVPAYTCERWRAGVHANRLYNDHVWTFGLRGSRPPEGLERYVEIDALVERDWRLERATYCGDDSIFLVARRPGHGRGRLGTSGGPQDRGKTKRSPRRAAQRSATSART